ncbi:MAG: protein kinase [Myxococcaceae bacterium]|nr:protein kinase [Myxococcaceae bacterium]
MLPLVVTIESADGHHRRRYAFADSPISVGRSPFAELQLAEGFVSRWEGTLRFDDREITYFSLGSTNPTFVDGREVASGEDIPLGPETVLTIGELQLRFSREHVPESDLRRRGKRKPVKEDPETALKTAYLESPLPAELRASSPSRAPTPPPPPPPSSSPPNVAAYGEDGWPILPSMQSAAAERHSVEPEPPGGVRVLGRVTVAGHAAPVRSDVETRLHVPRPSMLSPAKGADAPPRRPHGAPPPRASSSAPPPPAQPLSLEGQHAAYRAAWAGLFSSLSAELERAPAAERAELADKLQRSYPQTTREPEFRELLKRLGLSARRPEVLEVREWLADIAREVLPARMGLDTGLTLDRILGLLETLTQSLAEINDAQDTVRQRWLGRPARRSVLRSENGRAILAYLLNPQANWNERLVELEQTIREVVTHELALFKATMEGARLLVEALSPAAVAQAEGIDLEDLSDGAKGPGLWDRLRPKDSAEARLWKRFVSTHEALMDGDRYQRVFLGRVFARTYLAAMGQGEQTPRNG